MNEIYALEFAVEAKQNLDRLEKPTKKRITTRLNWVAENAANIPHKSLTGNWSGHFSLRVGDYRVIYQLDHDQKLIYVQRIRHRRNAYDDN